MTAHADEATTAQRAVRATEGARLRTLIVGAGIAGATMGALLQRRGEPAAIIERDERAPGAGYMLGLMPLGGRVLNGLGLAETYREMSIPVSNYDLYDRNGNHASRYPLASLIERYGEWRGIERGALVDLLRNAAGSIVFGTTLSAIDDENDGAVATFSDGSTAVFDVIVAADGLHSSTRGLILDRADVEYFDTGWGGFVLWSHGTASSQTNCGDTYSELWSAGWGVGVYPVPGRLGVFVAGRHDQIAQLDARDYVAHISERVPTGVFASALDSLDSEADGFYWEMSDARAKRWRRNRTVLLGDAAAAFLPTAGVGASAAMDSAAALVDELSRADSAHIEYALDLYERRQRHRVELAQKNSRDLARFMFVNGRRSTAARDQLMRFYSLDRMTSDISKVMAGA